MKNFINAVLVFLIISCAPVDKVSDKIEESHYALYNQKALFCVFKSKNGLVIFENPMKTKQWLCTNKQESKRWNVGDTLIIQYKGKQLSEKDTETFWSLKPYKNLK